MIAVNTPGEKVKITQDSLNATPVKEFEATYFKGLQGSAWGSANGSAAHGNWTPFAEEGTARAIKHKMAASDVANRRTP